MAPSNGLSRTASTGASGDLVAGRRGRAPKAKAGPGLELSSPLNAVKSAPFGGPVSNKDTYRALMRIWARRGARRPRRRILRGRLVLRLF